MIYRFVLYQIKLYKEIRKLRGRLIEVADRGRVLDVVTSNHTCGWWRCRYRCFLIRSWRTGMWIVGRSESRALFWRVLSSAPVFNGHSLSLLFSFPFFDTFQKHVKQKTIYDKIRYHWNLSLTFMVSFMDISKTIWRL